MHYQPARSHDYGINACPGCFEKQRVIDRLEEEIQQLRMKLSVQKRKDKEGFFGSSTPSARVPVKANATEEQRQKRGGAKVGHRGSGRRKHREEEVDCVREVAVEAICPQCSRISL